MTEASAPLYEQEGVSPAGKARWLVTSDGVRIRVAYWTGGKKGTVLIFPGRSEFIEKYMVVISAFVAKDYGVVIPDWRGQGLSDRLHQGDRRICHVGSFAEYQKDVDAMTEAWHLLARHRQCLVFAHSMGGCIAWRSVVERLDCIAAAFSAPMWGFNIRDGTRRIALLLAWIGCRAGLGMRKMPGTYLQSYASNVPFSKNVLTGNPELYKRIARLEKEYPQVAVGGPSFGWVQAAFGEVDRLGQRPPPPCPVHVWLGEMERVVSSRAVREFTAKWDGSAFTTVTGARHELAMETDSIRSQFYNDVDRFYLRYL